MQLFEQILSCYGWEGAALAGATLLMLGVQLYYYIFVYGRIPGYKNNRRPQTMDREPPVSVVTADTKFYSYAISEASSIDIGKV